MGRLPHLFMTHTHIRTTEDELNELKTIADRIYPGKGLTHLINVELRKHIRIKGDGKIKDGKKVRVHYVVPDNLTKPLNQLCSEKKISVSMFITRYILYPHLDK
jgi:hypothetical protein